MQKTSRRLRPALRRALFAGFILAAFFALNALTFTDRTVNPVMDLVQGEPTQIDCLIMGNSHAFTSLDAEALSDATGLEVYSLCSSAQNMAMTYENLKLTLEKQHPSLICLEVYPCMVDNRDTMSSTLLNLAQTNFDGYHNLFRRFTASLATVGWKNVMETTFPLLRPRDMWTRWDTSRWAVFNERAGLAYGYNARGSLIRASYSQAPATDVIAQASENYESWYHDSSLNTPLADYNQAALEDFLTLTQQQGIEVWLFKSPSAALSAGDLGALRQIESAAAAYDHVTYMDWDPFALTEIGLTPGDYYDDGSHMDRSGVAKYDDYFGSRLAQRLNVSYEPSQVLLYAGEQKAANADGTFTYRMESSRPDDTEYRFVLQSGSRVLEEQAFSAQNTFTTDADIDSDTALRLTVTMRCTALDAEKEFSFMKQNESQWG